MRFGQIIEDTEEAKNDESDLGPYLIRDEQETLRSKPENQMCNVTVRRNQGPRLLTCKSIHRG